MKRVVLVMAYGGPDSLDDIEPYLLDIRGGRPTSPALVAEIRERYAQIGGRSPLLHITNAQARALESSLNALARAEGSPPGYRVYVGMRHWTPYIADVVTQIAADGFDSGVAFCMAPHASRMSSGAYLQKLRDAQAKLAVPLQFDFIESWYDQPFLVQSLADKVRAAAQDFPAAERSAIHYLFTAHSLPAVLKEQGDPYESQLLATARQLAEALSLSASQWSFAYQSAGAAAGQWLGPAIEDVLPELAAAGKRSILVAPVGFMADHVEILFDLDIEAQQIAQGLGMRLVRSQSLNDTASFISGLAEFIYRRAENAQPVA
ncbi:MAG TPA: ferrochelatase [Anaerolineaceae bacterium]